MYRIDTLAKWTLSVGLAAALALVPLAGCASSGDASQDAEPAAEEPAETTEDTETEEAAETTEATPVWVAATYKVDQTLPDGSKSDYSSTYELDEAGNMIVESGDGGYQANYTYDEDGWLTKVESGGETFAYELEKDEQGRVVVMKNDDYKAEYSYNEQGYVSETVTTTVTFTIDENGDRVEGSESDMTMKATYDENGFPLSRERVYEGGRSETTYAYEYGDNGLPVSFTSTVKNYDSDGNELEETEATATGTLEYDEHGNIVKEVYEDEYGTSTYENTYVEIKNPSMAVQIQSHTKNL